MMGRGALTDKAQEIAKEFLGREITKRELRLIPYIHHQLLNEQKIEPDCINREERDVLIEWDKEGYIGWHMSGHRLIIKKKFWDFMCEILFTTYVDYN